MSDDWKYLRITLDIAIATDESPSRLRLVKDLLNERATNSDLYEALQEGWIEVDGYQNVEDHSE